MLTDTQWRRTWAVIGIASFVALIVWVLAGSHWDPVIVAQYAVAGLGTGAAAALVGVGLALTYEATGVFNVAFGALATFCAYVAYQLVVPWGLPLWAGVAITVLLVGPGMGAVFERAVFRPLQRRAASTSEKLLVTIAIFAVVLGVTVVIWGTGARYNAPLVFGGGAFRVGEFTVSSGTIGQLGVILVVSGAVTVLLRYTGLGRQIRAVVDRRELAELAGVRANRVAMIAWALGTGFAALAGVLYAPQQGLAPFNLTLLILETFSVVVIARLTNVGLAVVGGLGIGVVQSLLVKQQQDITAAWQGLQQVVPYLFVLALPLFLLIWRDLDEVGSEGTATGLVSANVGRRRRRNRLVGPGAFVALAAVGIAYVVGFQGMGILQELAATAIIFLSIVAITGFSGHITLGQAAFAGLGALLTAQISNGGIPMVPKLNPILAMLLAAAVVTVVGLATGYPALRRRGLILGLATLALNLVVYFMILQNAYFLRHTSFVNRPSIFGLSLTGDRAFYFFELVVLALALFLTGSLRSGRLGRILAAMRDSETGSQSIGIEMRRYKLFIFAASAFLASIGGSLIAQQQQTFSQDLWSPITSLFWFLAVVFAGLSYMSGAVVAAALAVGLDHVAGRSQASYIIIGFLTLLTVSFMRGGLVGWLLGRARTQLLSGLRSRFEAAQAAQVAEPDLEVDSSYVASPLAREALAGRAR